MNPVFESAALTIGAGSQIDSAHAVDLPLHQLAVERSEAEMLFRCQPPKNAAFLRAQADVIARALTETRNALEFQLPASVVLPSSTDSTTQNIPLPQEYLRQKLEVRFRPSPDQLRTRFRMRLADLEQSRFAGVATAAQMIRFAVVCRLVFDPPPAGATARRTVGSSAAPKNINGGTHKPYDSRPWTAESIRAAEKSIAGMQAYLSRLHLAVSLAPYMFADKEYQIRRSQTLIRLVHEARSLAVGQTGVIIRRVRRMAAEGRLNLGLSLSIPYFDDQSLELKLYDFVAIPGRIQFVPAFVALAARREQARVEQDAGRSQSTRMHLLSLLKDWERAFNPAPPE